MPRLQSELLREFPESNLKLVDLFYSSTINGQASLFTPSQSTPVLEGSGSKYSWNFIEPPINEPTSSIQAPMPLPCHTLIGGALSSQLSKIAIIGIAGKFPGADDPSTFTNDYCKAIQALHPSAKSHRHKVVFGSRAPVSLTASKSLTTNFGTSQRKKPQIWIRNNVSSWMSPTTP